MKSLKLGWALNENILASVELSAKNLSFSIGFKKTYHEEKEISVIAKDQILGTYRQLRLMAGATLILFPLAIVALGWFEYPLIQPTLSHYFFFEESPGYIRTMFTGFLVLVGGILIAYRGFDKRDDWVHNFAGVSSICVALFPKSKSEDNSDRFYSGEFFSCIHGPAAILLFLLAAYAVWYGGGKILKESLSDPEQHVLRIWKWISIVMMASGIGFYGSFLAFDRVFSFPSYVVLIVELLGFFGFASHWIVMTFVVPSQNEWVMC